MSKSNTMSAFMPPVIWRSVTTHINKHYVTAETYVETFSTCYCTSTPIDSKNCSNTKAELVHNSDGVDKNGELGNIMHRCDQNVRNPLWDLIIIYAIFNFTTSLDEVLFLLSFSNPTLASVLLYPFAVLFFNSVQSFQLLTYWYLLLYMYLLYNNK